MDTSDLEGPRAISKAILFGSLRQEYIHMDTSDLEGPRAISKAILFGSLRQEYIDKHSTNSAAKQHPNKFSRR